MTTTLNWNGYRAYLLALCVWREARGEGLEGMRAVAYVIRNRAEKWHKTIEEIVCARWQFSSMTAPGDGMLVQWPAEHDPSAPAFALAMQAADEVLAHGVDDPTRGATDYCNLHVCHPNWADIYRQVAEIGKHTFFVRS